MSRRSAAERPGGRSRSLRIVAATPARWSDVETLFGDRGACAGCWCMWWRLSRPEFEKGKGKANRRALRALIAAGRKPGLIAYADGRPVGWCALAPREDYPRLRRSRILAPVDDMPVWSIVCFFVDRDHRGRGVSTALLRAAVDQARRRGARAVEGYPVEPRSRRAPPVFVFTGLASAFRAAGFRECARRSETRPIMRHVIGSG